MFLQHEKCYSGTIVRFSDVNRKSTHQLFCYMTLSLVLKSDVPSALSLTIYFPNFCNSYEISKIIAFLTHICLASLFWNIDNSADPDQTPQSNTVFDQGLHCLLA